MAQLPVLVASAFILHLLWRLLRNYFVKSPLDVIPGPPSGSIIGGNMFQLLEHNSWDFHDHLIHTYGPVAKIHSFLGAKWLHVYDPKALHSIYLKDQDSYYRGEQSVSGVRLTLGPGLLGTSGALHKKQRKMLNPVFSGAHMRNLTPLFYDVAGKLRVAIETRVKEGPRDLDVLGWMGRTALELVGQGGLGYSFDPLTAESRDEFTEAVKAFIPAFADYPWIRLITPYLSYFGPAWFRRLLLNCFPIKGIHRLKHIVDTMHKRSEEIYHAKKTAIEKGDTDLLNAVGEGKDVMSVLLRENMKASAEDRLPDKEVLAQMGTFILAGVDTTSNVLSRVLHLLSQNQDVQDKLRVELHAAQEQYGRDIPYDELGALPYLDAVCRETLRLWAPVNLSNRQAKADTVLPLSQPLRCTDGTVLTEIPIPKGTMFFLNLRACNTWKELWGEDAQEWKPERWLKPLPKAVEDAHIPGIYAHLVTFISGGHSCIGFKFSQLEMKVVLSTLVSNFKFELSGKPIIWNFAGIAYPTTSHESSRPEMTLKVSLASR
ncbi:cytochrome P450 [Dichomitus squalens LYAD-421 SS1]|uniref:Cytochrome P450 n=1 Tax=Dichomitus squalens (strain LYAD-421) TaxID=732165 RepID=R7SIG8_DICSQ|nr:cytochrome P450 [Dichomitus squalens LYAD-421 SS1]EJF55944.1 cytochrome P450 [Dichomitus squalens LYAD-421 SS1]